MKSFLILGLIIVGVVTIIIVATLLVQKKGQKVETVQGDFREFAGAALTNIKMYKEREMTAVQVLLANFPNFTRESLYANIDELSKRIINGQNNGYISQGAFQKSATDKVLVELREMRKVETCIISYETNYASVAVIFKNKDNVLYQLLMRINVQNGLLYLDSYSATIWFNS